MYQFKKINDDEYKLITDNNEYTIKRNIDLAKEIQSVDLIATTIVAEFLAERGETYENTKLRTTIQDNNKTTIDESNLKRLEERARNQAYYDVMNKIFKKTTGLGYMDTIKEAGISYTDLDGVGKFVNEFTGIILNGIDDTPRSEDTPGDRTEPKE